MEAISTLLEEAVSGALWETFQNFRFTFQNVNSVEKRHHLIRGIAVCNLSQ